ncbi:hypothetical protein [Antrihabitans cavernicola]|uniref:Uncharacterized protein n=1 Tax=Antrihabitans cavernicola TaxID=2495913 RepID=A0A5A7S1A6_9NOCA|nr:hypothetical protein [Spelaeibacter cavernicola]KAA0017059.1 hypothetical protein FOY51_25300 [Spelaeibacter cavernicola]
MHLPSCTDMFDRRRLESAFVALTERARHDADALDTDALDAAQRLLDLGIGLMPAARTSAGPFQVQPMACRGHDLPARATRLAASPDTVLFSVGYPRELPTATETHALHIVWFNLDSLTGGTTLMTSGGCVRGPGAAMRVAMVMAGRGGVVAAISYGSPGAAQVHDGRPGFIYMH